jgi:hypothetical protein
MVYSRVAERYLDGISLVNEYFSSLDFDVLVLFAIYVLARSLSWRCNVLLGELVVVENLSLFCPLVVHKSHFDAARLVSPGLVFFLAINDSFGRSQSFLFKPKLSLRGRLMQRKIFQALFDLFNCLVARRRHLSLMLLITGCKITNERDCNNVGLPWLACVMFANFEYSLDNLALLDDCELVSHIVSRRFAVAVEIVVRFFVLLASQGFIGLVGIDDFAFLLLLFILGLLIFLLVRHLGPVLMPVDRFNRNLRSIFRFLH